MIIIGTMVLLAFLAWPGKNGEIRYVALGDSYTAGTGIAQDQSWPKLLADDLKSDGVKIKLVANLAVNSKATKEIISEQLPKFDRLSSTFATILVGVNDFNRGYPKEEFRRNLGVILDHMLTRLPSSRIVVLTIPDFSVTPTGATFGNPLENSRGVAEFNKIIKMEAAKRNLAVVDVYFLSQEMGKDSSLVAPDGLHPSEKEYAKWEKIIFPVVYDLLKPK